MAVILATDETFHEAIAQGVSLVDFYSTHCGPCRVLLPKLMEIETELPFINLVKVNIDDCPQVANEFRISGVPDIYLAKDGQMTEYQAAYDPDSIKDALGALLYD